MLQRREMKLTLLSNLNEFQESFCGMGGAKGKFLKLWADKYEFKPFRQKARE